MTDLTEREYRIELYDPPADNLHLTLTIEIRAEDFRAFTAAMDDLRQRFGQWGAGTEVGMARQRSRLVPVEGSPS